MEGKSSVINSDKITSDAGNSKIYMIFIYKQYALQLTTNKSVLRNSNSWDYKYINDPKLSLPDGLILKLKALKLVANGSMKPDGTQDLVLLSC